MIKKKLVPHQDNIVYCEELASVRKQTLRGVRHLKSFIRNPSLGKSSADIGKFGQGSLWGILHWTEMDRPSQPHYILSNCPVLRKWIEKAWELVAWQLTSLLTAKSQDFSWRETGVAYLRGCHGALSSFKLFGEELNIKLSSSLSVSMGGKVGGLQSKDNLEES